ncbi:hypothetical protein WJX73_003327 [Symbiochloris irregularis]|uniref:Uncharacterized protein n=1 Tax=Symbiochloris irregularis TaxID=706552 RepID=A0AAW1PC22_9CHLO
MSEEVQGLVPRAWPGFSETDYRTLCHEMRVSVADIRKGDVAALKEVFARTLAAVQDISGNLRRGGNFDPSSLPRCMPKDFWDALRCTHEREEPSLALKSQGTSHTQAKAAFQRLESYFLWRNKLQDLGSHCLKLKGGDTAWFLYPETMTMGVTLVTRGLRLTQDGMPILEVQFRSWIQ